MNGLRRHIEKGVAFLMIVGNAALSFACRPEKKSEPVNPEMLVTMRTEDLTMVVSRNGLKSYYFETPLREQFGEARDPYDRYPEGIFVQTYQDSTEVVESTLRADRAIYYSKRDLWMASGNVVASGSGNTLYTDQLFWDAKTDRVYSNVKVRVEDANGIHFGEGIESNKGLESWVFHEYEGTMAIDTTPYTGGGQEQTEAPASDSAAEPAKTAE